MRTVSRTAVPALTTEQMRAVDHAMVEDLHIELVQMMENAGRSLAELAIIRFSPCSVTIHLANRGCQVQVVLTEPGHLTPVPAHQADILARMGVTIASRPATADLIIDALIGYSLRGDPAGAAAQLITWANGQAAPVLALDTPSGLDLTTGTAATPAVWAAATLTLALPKVGLLDAPNVGELYLADISVPALVYHRMGIPVPGFFRQSSLLRID